MTDHDTVDHHDLDRRAAAAIADLDRAVDATPVPDFDAAPSSRRSVPAVAIAAGLLVVALVAAAVVLTGGENERSTVAGQVGVTHLALPDPGSLGVRINTAFDGRESADARSDSFDSVVVTVQGPADADDPWESAVVGYALPAEATTLDGEPVDIGGPEAAYTDAGVAGTVGWRDGDEVRYLVSARLDRQALITLAADAVEQDGTIPGQRVLHTGSVEDVFPMLLTTIGRGGLPGSDISGIAYASLDDAAGDSGLLVTTQPGSDAAFRATHALASRTERTVVRGHAAVVATFASDDDFGIVHVSWLEDDGTLARADALGFSVEQTIGYLDTLEAIDAAAFARLVDEHGFGDAPDPSLPGGGEGETFEETGEPISPTTSVDARNELASVSGEEDGATFRAAIFADPGGLLELNAVEISPTGESGVGQGLDSTSANAVLRDVGSNVERVLIAGVVGPNAVGIAVVDPDTGERVSDSDPSAIGPSTATIPDSEHVLFLAVLGPEYADRDLAIIATLADGSEVTLEAPAD